MESLSGRKKVLEQKPMNFWERMYLPAIAQGLGITLKHLFKKKATIQYPFEEREFSKNYRGMHSLKRDEQGRERCTACGLCALSCPAEAITMISAERKKEEANLYREEKYAAVYEINMLRCIFCGLCEEACPKEAIYLDGPIVPSEYLRKDFIYGKDKLVEKPLAELEALKNSTK
ncbi:NuoI/complex I 23 kDa subunit family protein [Pseudopedobacter beijingensis]|uniref:NADH-quinone oxidoreductase subunit I n=1 Tax=Pseudopedobacter beijingensis TaxID=1207056 RepID=A0ABW4I8T4_9SPHI